jgi:hypothetical protein
MIAKPIIANMIQGIQEPWIVVEIWFIGNLNVPTIMPIKKAIVADS